MLIAEYSYETDIAVQRAEERQIAFAKGIQQGIQQGIQRGITKGAYQKALETAKMMKREAFDTNMIAKMTSLSKEEIEKL